MPTRPLPPPAAAAHRACRWRQTAEEVALIRLFYDGGGHGRADWPAFETLEEGGLGGDLIRTFGEAAQRDLVLATGLMVAYADGALTGEELAAVRAVADEIGATPARVDELLALVKDYMLTQLASLPDSGSVAVVARELG
jgi:hypothetical protein